MKDYINGDIWDFERDIVVPGDRPVILGLDGGATSTICVCMPFLPFSSPLPDPLPVLSRAVTGCSNRNSVGGQYVSSVTILSSISIAAAWRNSLILLSLMVNWLHYLLCLSKLFP